MKTPQPSKKPKERKKKYIILSDASSTLSEQDQNERKIKFQKYKRYYASLSTAPHAWQYFSEKSNATHLYPMESIERFDFNGRIKRHYYAPISFLSKCSRFGKVNLQPQASRIRVGIHLINSLLYQPFYEKIKCDQNHSSTLLQGYIYRDKSTQVDFESSQDSSEHQPMLVNKNGLENSLKFVINVSDRISHNISQLVAAVHCLCSSLKGYNCMVLRMLEQRMQNGNIEHNSGFESLSDKIFLNALGYRHARLSSEDSIVVKPLREQSLVVLLNDYIEKNCPKEQGQLCIDKSLQEKIHAVDCLSNDGLILQSGTDGNASLCSSQKIGSNGTHQPMSFREKLDDDLVSNKSNNLKLSHPVQYNTSVVAKNVLQQLYQKMQTKTMLNDLSFYRVVEDFYDIALQCCEYSEVTEGSQQPSDLVNGLINPSYNFSEKPREISHKKFVTLIPETVRKTLHGPWVSPDERSDKEGMFSLKQTNCIDSPSSSQNSLSLPSPMLSIVNKSHAENAIISRAKKHGPSLREYHHRQLVASSQDKNFSHSGVAKNCVSNNTSDDSNGIGRGFHEDFNISCVVKDKGKVDRFFVPKAHDLKKGYLINISSSSVNESSSDSIQQMTIDEFKTEKRKGQCSFVFQGNSDNANIISESTPIKDTYESDSSPSEKDTEKMAQENKCCAKTPLYLKGHDFAKWEDVHPADWRKHEDSQNAKLSFNFSDTNMDSNDVSHDLLKGTLTQNRKRTLLDSSEQKQFYDIKYDLPDEATTNVLSEEHEQERSVLNDDEEKKTPDELKVVTGRSSQTTRDVETMLTTRTTPNNERRTVKFSTKQSELKKKIPIGRQNELHSAIFIMPTGPTKQKAIAVPPSKALQTTSSAPESDSGGITSLIQDCEVQNASPVGETHQVPHTKFNDRVHKQLHGRFFAEDDEKFRTSLVASKEAWKTREDNQVWEPRRVVAGGEKLVKRKDLIDKKALESEPRVAKNSAWETTQVDKKNSELESAPRVTLNEAWETTQIDQENSASESESGIPENEAWETTQVDEENYASESEPRVALNETWEMTQVDQENSALETTQVDQENSALESEPRVAKGISKDILRKATVSENRKIKFQGNDNVMFQKEKETNGRPVVYEADPCNAGETGGKVKNQYYEDKCDVLTGSAKNEKTLASEKKTQKDLRFVLKNVRLPVPGNKENKATGEILRGSDAYKTKKITRGERADSQGENRIVLKQPVKQYENMIKNGIKWKAEETKQKYVYALKKDVLRKNIQTLIKRKPKLFGKEELGFDNAGEREGGTFERNNIKRKNNLFFDSKTPHLVHRSLKEMSLRSKEMKKIAGDDDETAFLSEPIFSSYTSNEKKADQGSFRKKKSNENDKRLEKRETTLPCECRNHNGMMQKYRYAIRTELLRAVRAQNLKGMKKCILEMENLLQQAERKLNHQEEKLALERQEKMALQTRVEADGQRLEKLQEQLTKMTALLHKKEEDGMVCLDKLKELNSYVGDMEKQYYISLKELEAVHEKDKKKIQNKTKQLENLTTCQETYEKENRILKNKIIKYESQLSCGDIILSQRGALLQELTTRMERKLAYIDVLETQKNAYQRLVSSLNETFTKTSRWPQEAQMIKDTLQQVHDENYKSLCEKLEQTLFQLHQKPCNSLQKK